MVQGERRVCWRLKGPGTDKAPLVHSTQILDTNLSSIGHFPVNQKGPPAAFKFKTRRFSALAVDRGLQLGPAWPQGRLGGVRAWGRGLVNVPGLGILITPRLSLLHLASQAVGVQNDSFLSRDFEPTVCHWREAGGGSRWLQRFVPIAYCHVDAANI